MQKTHQKTVIFKRNKTKISAISEVELKGKEKPFSWDYASDMKTLKNDCWYELTTTFETGYNLTKIKFVLMIV